MDERPGNPECQHEWVTDDIVIATNPPLYHRICERCGRVEHINGAEILPSRFGEIFQKFHSAKETP